jgi:error-prone DNA polymerase
MLDGGDGRFRLIALAHNLKGWGALCEFITGRAARGAAQIEHELALIAELRYEPYFLTVHDIVRFARGRGILCQGRGSAANSAVCYCLGITEVDPARMNAAVRALHQPRAQRAARHRRRLRARAARGGHPVHLRASTAATAPRWPPRGHQLPHARALRDVGKALGWIAASTPGQAPHWWDGREGAPQRTLAEAGLDPGDRTVRSGWSWPRS